MPCLPPLSDGDTSFPHTPLPVETQASPHPSPSGDASVPTPLSQWRRKRPHTPLLWGHLTHTPLWRGLDICDLNEKGVWVSRLHRTLLKPLPPLCRPTSPTNQITISGIMRFPAQQKGTHARIRPGLGGLSRTMTRSPGRRSAPKDGIQDRKGNACDGRALLQRGRFRIQGLPLDGIGRLLSPSGDLVRGKSYVCFGILPVHGAKSFDLFLPLMCLFPCQSAKIFGRPRFLLFLGPRHSILCGYSVDYAPLHGRGVWGRNVSTKMEGLNER